MNKKQIPFPSCDFCVFMIENQLKDWGSFLILYKEKYPKKKIHIRSLDDIKKYWSKPLGKCPFNYKPNLKIPLRKHYRMKCFGCGQYFICPADIYRNNIPYCGECLADIGSAEYDQMQEDKWYREHPGQDPEEEYRNQVYLQKYGEN